MTPNDKTTPAVPQGAESGDSAPPGHARPRLEVAAPDMSHPGEPAETLPASRRRPRLRISGAHRFIIFAAWAVMIIVFTVLRPTTFWSAGTIQAVLNSQSPLVLLAVAIVPTLVVGDYDLTVAANAGLTSTIIATTTIMHGWPLWIGIVSAVVVSLLVGLVTAFLVVSLNLNSIIMTLGMATLLDGISLAISGSQTISGVGQGFSNAFTVTVGGIQIAVLYILIVALCVSYILQLTPLGRKMVFSGGSRPAAQLAGINTTRLRYGAYLAGSAMAALSGITSLASQGGVTPGLSETQLLPAFAAAFFSTVIFTAGRFNAWGTVAAIYFLTTGIVGLQILGGTGWTTDVFYGAALVVAVAGFSIVRKRSSGEAS